MLTVIFKQATGVDDLHSGQWRLLKLEGQMLAILCCPSCGKCRTIRAYLIKENGDITPSLVCPHACSFHAKGTLEGWEAPKPPAAGA